MVERGARPTRRRMTCLACCREHSRDVIRVRSRLVFGFMTAVTVRRSARVLAADMATRARHIHVRTCQRETRIAVVESGRLPGRRTVTNRAVEGEPGSLVVRIGCRVVIVEVTTRASRTQAVVPVHVACSARKSCMRTCQREPCFTVIECGAGPRRRRVTYGAIRRESSGDVVRIRSLIEVGEMTRRATGGRP